MAAARALLPLVCAAVAAAENMNGRYSVTSGIRHDVDFNDDYAARGHEFFDVWSPEIATHYGEVRIQGAGQSGAGGMRARVGVSSVGCGQQPPPRPPRATGAGRLGWAASGLKPSILLTASFIPPLRPRPPRRFGPTWATTRSRRTLWPASPTRRSPSPATRWTRSS
jgi:hypothetical protein